MDDGTKWNDCKDERKHFCRACHTQTKAFYRQNNNDDETAPSPDRAETDESGDSEQESDNCARLPFDRIAPAESLFNNKPISEIKKE